jgi:putative CocE/NonD family hydrolase
MRGPRRARVAVALAATVTIASASAGLAAPDRPSSHERDQARASGHIATRTVAVATGPSAPVSPVKYDVGEQQNVPVKMQDGVVLRVDVFFPVDRKTAKPARGPFPSLLTQTPYGKNAPFFSTLGGADTDLVSRGYIEVVADVRGRGGSQGTFDFWGPQERRDGVKLARFAARLPHSNGKVGLTGGSYLGQTQLLTEAVAGKHSPIKAAVPVVTIDNVGQDGYYGGMPNFGFGLLYAVLFPASGLLGLYDYLGANDPVDLANRGVGSVTSSLSLSGPLVTDMALGGPAAHDGPYWHDRNIQTHLQAIAATHIPTLLVGGWYDIMGKGSSMIYTGLQNALHHRPTYLPLPPKMRTDPRVQWVNGPWTHSGSVSAAVTHQLQLLWFDHWLKGIDNGIDKPDATAHLQVIGTTTKTFLNTNAWPLAGAKSQVYYFGGAGGSGAASLNDGQLTTTRPPAAIGQDAVAWSGVSSPCSVRFKIQTAGLADSLPAAGTVGQACGPDSEQTTEVGGLTYTSAPLPSTKVVAGPIGVDLFASSTRPDAEFIVGISTVDASGHATSVQSGALLGSLRQVIRSYSWYDTNGHVMQPFHPFTAESSQPLTPGKVTEFQIGMWPTAFEVQKGQSIRITVSTSDIPYAMPSIPTIPNLVGGVYQVQRNKLYPSAVTIPMVNPSRLSAAP